MARFGLVVFFVAACGHEQPVQRVPYTVVSSPVVTEIRHDGSGGSGEHVQNAAPACAATLRESIARTGCTLGEGECTYATGSCSCAPPAQCGGAYLHHEPGMPGVWACTSTDPSVLRGDGCPLAVPNGACSGEGRSCDYSVCSWNRTIAHCRRGSWDIEHIMGPPPP
jgi:hypothetical protein